MAQEVFPQPLLNYYGHSSDEGAVVKVHRKCCTIYHYSDATGWTTEECRQQTYYIREDPNDICLFCFIHSTPPTRNKQIVGQQNKETVQHNRHCRFSYGLLFLYYIIIP